MSNGEHLTSFQPIHGNIYRRLTRQVRPCKCTNMNLNVFRNEALYTTTIQYKKNQQLHSRDIRERTVITSIDPNITERKVFVPNCARASLSGDTDWLAWIDSEVSEYSGCLEFSSGDIICWSCSIGSSQGISRLLSSSCFRIDSSIFLDSSSTYSSLFFFLSSSVRIGSQLSKRLSSGFIFLNDGGPLENPKNAVVYYISTEKYARAITHCWEGKIFWWE